VTRNQDSGAVDGGASRPRISVIIPTHNRPAPLARAISSVRSQTWTDYEILVVDDGSNDPVAMALDGFPDARLRLLAHPCRRGAAAARNTGLRAARGDYVAFLDDDDEWVPQKLERQLAQFTAAPADTGLVYSGAQIVSDRSGQVVLTRVPYPPAVQFVDLLGATVFSTSTPLIRRACFAASGPFDESLPGLQDRDLWLRIARHFRFAFIPEALTIRHIHGRQISTTLALKVAAAERMLAKYHADLSRHPPLLARQLARLAMLYFADGHAAKGRRCLLRALRRGLAWRELGSHIALSFVAPTYHRRLVTKTAFRQIDGLALFG